MRTEDEEHSSTSCRAMSQVLVAAKHIPVDYEVTKLPRKLSKCHGQLTIIEFLATMFRATMVLPEYTGCSLENPVGCAGELCAGNVCRCLLRAQSYRKEKSI